jgi:hypothetical protein
MAWEPIAGLSPAPFTTVADEDTEEGCLCLVAGYASTNGLIAKVTAAAGRRVRQSPALGDVLKLRYVDLGPRPGPDGDLSDPVRRIADDLMTVQETALRTHFALIVIAKAATTIEGLLSGCAAEPFLASLRMRCTGIASFDDRDEGEGRTDITTAPDGSWRSERELTDALHQRCADLPRDFAERGDAGMTRTELAVLRQDWSESALWEAEQRASAGGDAPDSTPAATTATTDAAPVPDVLDAPGTNGPAPAPGAASAGGASAAPADGAGTGPADGAADKLAAAAARALATLSPAKLLAGIPMRRGKPEASAGGPDLAPEQLPRTALGLAYLLTVLDHDAAPDPALGRLQAAVLDVGKRIAALPGMDYRVSVIHGDDKQIASTPRTAGRIIRRPVKRSVRTEDFTAVLKVLRSSLRDDSELVQSRATAETLSVASPVVIIFTVDPPMAEPGAAAVFGDIAAQARVVWVVPRKLEGLVSPAFSRECGATVLGEHQAVADDILDLMRADAPPPEEGDGPDLTPGIPA